MKGKINEEVDEEISRILKISPALIMRKFKFTFEMAKNICDFIGERRLDQTWTCVKDLLPTNEIEVCVYAKPLKQVNDAFDYYIAILDVHSGWKDCASGEFLYVKKWMKLPLDGNEEKHD